MKIILIILLIFIQNVALATTKLNIINNLKEINNIKFNFIQKIGKKT